MKRLMKTIALVGMLAGVTVNVGAAEMKKVVILNFHGDLQRMSMTTRAIQALEQAGFVNGQNIELTELRLPDFEAEMAQVRQLSPAVVIDLGTRPQQTLEALANTGIPVIGATGIESYVNAEGIPNGNVTGIYSTLHDMVYNSYKFLQKVSPLTSGQQAVFLENPQYNLIPKEAVQEALQRLNIPLKAVVNTTIYEDWQEAILKYNDDPEVGWILLGIWPTVTRDGTHVDWETVVAPWGREHQKKAIVTYWEIAVKWGILCGFGADLDEIAAQCGEMAARVLKGEDIKTIKAEYPRKTLVALNRKTADFMGIVFPPDVLNLANVIYHDWEGKEVTRKSGLK